MPEVYTSHRAQRKGRPSAFCLKRLERNIGQKEWPMCQDSSEERNIWQPSQRFGVTFKLLAKGREQKQKQTKSYLEIKRNHAYSLKNHQQIKLPTPPKLLPAQLSFEKCYVISSRKYCITLNRCQPLFISGYGRDCN